MKLHNTLSALHLAALHHKHLFADLSIKVESKELLLVEGKNGTGKSSLLRILVGLVDPQQGNIFWNTKPISSHHIWYVSHLHYVGHSNGLKLGLTVLENLKLTAYQQLSSPQLSEDALLEILQLTKEKNSLVKDLSAGQKRRLALAKLFLFPKNLWVLDEPFTTLDLYMQEILQHELKNHLSQNGIAIISSHHPIFIKDVNIKTLRLNPCYD